MVTDEGEEVRVFREEEQQSTRQETTRCITGESGIQGPGTK